MKIDNELINSHVLQGGAIDPITLRIHELIGQNATFQKKVVFYGDLRKL
jgi:hypothetical protein